MSCPHAKLMEFLFYVRLERTLDCLPKQLMAHIMKISVLVELVNGSIYCCESLRYVPRFTLEIFL
jgi:hypothetical protein